MIISVGIIHDKHTQTHTDAHRRTHTSDRGKLRTKLLFHETYAEPEFAGKRISNIANIIDEKKYFYCYGLLAHHLHNQQAFFVIKILIFLIDAILAT